jgi:transcriptional regulator with GAF, ATPase, and Fis domain
MVAIKKTDMSKRLTREQKNQKAVEDLINKMFEIAGYDISYVDIKDRKDAWYTEWTMTVAQNEEWKKWGRQYLKEKFRYNKLICEREMNMVSLMWGLKFSDLEYNLS